ncbi:MAG: holo-[acyl-carrier-protein] synthase [Deltaproteobacteria bacterium]|nr:holo-[acyl-carrier-protein] synthase [Deltaproteobacteria bacterium]
MILGVGVDLIEVVRVKDALEDPRIGRRVRQRVFTPQEIEYCEARKRKFESYAGRFAAKEAVMKALGRGWGRRLGWSEIEVVLALTGEPGISLHNKAADFARELGVDRFSLSITHSESYAIAYLIAEGKTAPPPS